MRVPELTVIHHVLADRLPVLPGIENPRCRAAGDGRQLRDRRVLVQVRSAYAGVHCTRRSVSASELVSPSPFWHGSG